jgi:transcription elongation factor GreA
MHTTTKWRLTEAGLVKLNLDLDRLRNRYKQLTDRIMSKDTLNAGEDMFTAESIFEQETTLKQISALQNVLENADMLEAGTSDQVELGSSVTVSYDNHIRTLLLVDSLEADPLTDRISTESPIGKALLQKKVGDKVLINLPTGQRTYHIKAIS